MKELPGAYVTWYTSLHIKPRPVCDPLLQHISSGKTVVFSACVLELKKASPCPTRVKRRSDLLASCVGKFHLVNTSVLGVYIKNCF